MELTDGLPGADGAERHWHAWVMQSDKGGRYRVAARKGRFNSPQAARQWALRRVESWMVMVRECQDPECTARPIKREEPKGGSASTQANKLLPY